MMRSPLLGVAACWALGIALENALGVGPAATRCLLAAAVAALLGALLALGRKRRLPAVSLAAVGFVLAGAVAAALFPHRFPPNHIRNLAEWGFDTRRPVPVVAVIESVPIRTPSGFQFESEIRQVGENARARTATGKVLMRLRVPAKAASWAAAGALGLQAGDVIRAPVRFYHPTAYRNPGGFDYGRWLASIEDVTWEGTIANPLDVHKLGGRGISGVSLGVERVRRRLLDGIDHLYAPWSAEGRDSAVLKAVLLGDRSALDSDTIESFRKSGLYHLLVISGLHVGLLAALALALFRLLGLREAWRGGALLLLLAAYALLVEQRAPTLRATLMIALYLLARYLYRDKDGLNAVGFAALILLVIRPTWLFEAGFQLSFSAALLIFAVVVPILERTTILYSRALNSIEEEDRDVALAPWQAQLRLDIRALIELLKQRISFLRRRVALARGIVIFTLKAVLWAVDLTIFSGILQIGLLMPMAESFHRITLAGIGLNTLAFPVMTVLLGLAVPTVLLSATVPALAVVPGKLLAGVIAILFALSNAPHLPLWLSYRVPSPPAWVAWGFALSVVAAAWLLVQQRPKAFAAAVSLFALFAILVAWYPFAARIPTGELEATALDCGRGQATFFVLPDRTTVLVGACGAKETWSGAADYQGRWDPGEDIVSPYLWSRGLKHIDILAETGSQPGMLEGMAAVIRNFRPRELWEEDADRGSQPEELARLIQTESGRMRMTRPGEVIREGDASFEFLPAADPEKTIPAARESPLALRLTIRGRSMMLAGELNEENQAELARPSKAIASDVLETSEQGGGLSVGPELLEKVSPRLVLLSGRGRIQPDLPALPNNVRILSTQQDGAITVELKTSGLSYHFDELPKEGAAEGSASRTFSGYMAQ
jgi:competence protein ComEC